MTKRRTSNKNEVVFSAFSMLQTHVPLEKFEVEEEEDMGS